MEALVDKLCNRFAGVNGIICSLLQSKYTEYLCCLCVLPLMANQLPIDLVVPLLLFFFTLSIIIVAP